MIVVKTTVLDDTPGSPVKNHASKINQKFTRSHLIRRNLSAPQELSVVESTAFQMRNMKSYTVITTHRATSRRSLMSINSTQQMMLELFDKSLKSSFLVQNYHNLYFPLLRSNANFTLSLSLSAFKELTFVQMILYLYSVGKTVSTN